MRSCLKKIKPNQNKKQQQQKKNSTLKTKTILPSTKQKNHYSSISNILLFFLGAAWSYTIGTKNKETK